MSKKKFTIVVTSEQLSAINDLADEIEAMQGGAEVGDEEREKNIKLIRKMFKANGLRIVE